MTFIWPSKGKYEASWLPKFNPATNAITGLPTTLFAYAVGTTTRLTLYTDETGTTQLTNNPIPVGVAQNHAGLDVNGTLILFGDVGRFDLVADGNRITLAFKPSVDDLTSLMSQLTSGSFLAF